MYRVRGADEKEYGPVSVEQIQQWIRDRRLNAQSLAATEGTVGWKPLSTFPEFAEALAAQAAPIPPAASVPGPGPIAPGDYIPGVGLPPAKTNTFALVGLIMGCVSVLCTCGCYGVPFNVLGLVFSILGLSQIKAANPAEKGREMAIAGIILSILSFVIVIIFLIIGFALNVPELMKKMKNF